MLDVVARFGLEWPRPPRNDVTALLGEGGIGQVLQATDRWLKEGDATT